MNEFAITRELKKNGKLFLFVEKDKAVFRGMKWEELGDFGKRKMENMIFLSKMNKTYIKVCYV